MKENSALTLMNIGLKSSTISKLNTIIHKHNMRWRNVIKIELYEANSRFKSQKL